MSSINFIGGEKGGVGKSVMARVLAQYFIDRKQPFVGFDTDRSHASFTRFYEDFAAPVVVDSYEGLDLIAAEFEEPPASGAYPSVIVDLAAQTAAPLSRWMRDSELLPLMTEMGVTVNFWHLADSGKDSVDLLERLVETFGDEPNYFVVRNFGRGSDFTALDNSPALRKILAQGGRVLTLGALHEASMRKIDHHNSSFWAAVNNRAGNETLGMLERQRVKSWLRNIYQVLDELPL